MGNKNFTIVNLKEYIVEYNTFFNISQLPIRYEVTQLNNYYVVTYSFNKSSVKYRVYSGTAKECSEALRYHFAEIKKSVESKEVTYTYIYHGIRSLEYLHGKFDTSVVAYLDSVSSDKAFDTIEYTVGTCGIIFSYTPIKFLSSNNVTGYSEDEIAELVNEFNAIDYERIVEDDFISYTINFDTMAKRESFENFLWFDGNLPQNN